MTVINTIFSSLRCKKAEMMFGRVKKQKLTYLTEAKIQSLINIVGYVEKNNIPGSILEAGCALGGSSIVIATAKNSKRLMSIYDVFGMIPPPTDKDGLDVHERYNIILSGKSQGIDGDKYYGYVPDLYDLVVYNFEHNKVNMSKNNIQLIKGLLQDTLVIEEPVSLAHIDVDWYDPVMTCLARIEPKLSIGGVLVLDDYLDWSGCHRATDEYFSDKKGFKFDSSSGALVITKLL